MAKLTTAVTDKDHTQGPDDAPVTLVEYGDYQCPSCGEAAPVVARLRKQFGDRLRFVFRNFPLPQHDMAEPAAEFAEYAASEDKFWPVHDALYERQDELGPELFAELAGEQGLDRDAAADALEREEFASRIEADMKSGEASGLRGTPTFYINGSMHTGSYDYESLSEAIKSAAA